MSKSHRLDTDRGASGTQLYDNPSYTDNEAQLVGCNGRKSSVSSTEKPARQTKTSFCIYFFVLLLVTICIVLIVKIIQIDHEAKPKSGKCPPLPKDVGVCIASCSIDKDCSFDQKCCSNGCGHTCKQPFYGIFKQTTPLDDVTSLQPTTKDVETSTSQSIIDDDTTTIPPGVMSCDKVTIVTRQEWGARDSVTINNMTTPVSFVFIHHTAMNFCHNQHNCSQELRTIQNFHMDNRSWDDIGYNFLIGEDGRVYEARGWDRIGAHTYGWNDVAVGFSIMGDYTDRIPNDKALSALKNIINCGLSKGKITHNYKMYGHRDVRTTECPGDKLYELIETWDHFGHSQPVKPTKGP